MAVSKRLRFEILKRDGHMCRYCGATAPDAPLTVDHVTPVALGGSDEPGNLVTACTDCNSGKSSVPPGAPLVDAVSADALRWAAAMTQAANERSLAQDAARQSRAVFTAAWGLWKDWRGDPVPLPAGWTTSVDHFLAAGLQMDDLFELIDVAMAAKAKDTWRYFCGCAWTRVRQLQDRAREIVNDAASIESPAQLTTSWTTEQIDREVSASEGYASRWLETESIESAFCPHRDWGGGDCGDPVCRIQRAETLKWMADSKYVEHLKAQKVLASNG